ncbi:MAG: phosphoribosylformylglycinamidine cyclo-ligase [Pseudomonadota bacterium]
MVKKGLTYQAAGVDVACADEFIESIKPMVRRTFRSGVLVDIGGFGGLFSLNTEKYPRPVLVASTDGVGTKIKVAQAAGRHNTVGIDLVAMCVNDVAVMGATPLFFLDYLAVGKLDAKMAAELVSGMTEGCLQAKCSLIGGETAEMPGIYGEGEYDLAGFSVGVVDHDSIIDGSCIAVGQKIVGIASSGLHSNGYSLVRRVVFDVAGLQPDSELPGCGRSVADELLEPTKIYADLILNLLKEIRITGICHVTGGGIPGNLPRILPKGVQARIKRGSWEVPPVFGFLQEAGGITDQEMLRTFNMGLGLLLVVPDEQVQDLLLRATAMKERAFVVGDIAARKPGQPPLIISEKKA